MRTDIHIYTHIYNMLISRGELFIKCFILSLILGSVCSYVYAYKYTHIHNCIQGGGMFLFINCFWPLNFHNSLLLSDFSFSKCYQCMIVKNIVGIGSVRLLIHNINNIDTRIPQPWLINPIVNIISTWFRVDYGRTGLLPRILDLWSGLSSRTVYRESITI